MNRQSNIELLRIIAMFMILGLHVNFFSLGVPMIAEYESAPFSSFMRFLMENICIVGVNIYVLISGWFGIRYKTKSVCNFIFQCLFFSIILFIPFAATGRIEIGRINIMSSLLMYKNAYWFVWAYLILYILSPILNSFTETTDRKTFKRVLVSFFAIQTIVFIFTPCGFFKAGYSPLSFIGLYLLARYLRNHTTIRGKYIYLGIYLLCAFANTITCIVPPMYGISNETINAIIISYTNPINIIGALSLLIFFTRLSFKSKIINYISNSCFAVYLIHMHFCISNKYLYISKRIYNENDGIIYIAYILTFIVAVFLLSILFDKVRIKVFNTIWNSIEKTTEQ